VTLPFLGPCAVVVGATYQVFDVPVFPVASDIPQYSPWSQAAYGFPGGWGDAGWDDAVVPDVGDAQSP